MKKKLLLIGIPAAVSLAAAAYFMSMSGGTEVTATKVTKGDISEYVEELGTVELRDSLKVSSPVSGEVLEILVKAGDEVAEGDILLKMDGSDVTRNLAELDTQVIAVQAQLNDARRAGNINSIASLELDISNLSATIKEDETKLENLKSLFEAGAVSQEEYRASERALETQKLTLQKLKLQLNQLRNPVSQNIIAQFEAQLKQLQIQRESLVDLQGDFTLTAGISGTVMNLEAEKGTFLQPGIPVMEIGDVSSLYVEADVLVGDIEGITEGTKVQISSKDLNIDGLAGKVSLIHPNAFTKISDLGIEQKRIRVEVDFENGSTGLRPGYDLEARFILNESKDALIIPESSVFKMDGKSFVFVADNGKAVLREVETGIESGREIEVLSGLAVGELVIESPDSDLEEGAKIKINEQ